MTGKETKSRDEDSDDQNPPDEGIKSLSATMFSINEQLRKDEEQ